MVDVMKLAREAGAKDLTAREILWIEFREDELNRFAALVLEEAAKIVFDMPLKADDRHEYRWEDTYKCAALECAQAIRAAKPKTE